MSSSTYASAHPFKSLRVADRIAFKCSFKSSFESDNFFHVKSSLHVAQYAVSGHRASLVPEISLSQTLHITAGIVCFSVFMF